MELIKLPTNEEGEISVYTNESVDSFVADYSTTQTTTTIITPPAGEHIEIKSIFVSSSANSGALLLTGATTGTIFKAYLSSQTSTATGSLHLNLADDEILLLSCPANTFVSVNYYFES